MKLITSRCLGPAVDFNDEERVLLKQVRALAEEGMTITHEGMVKMETPELIAAFDDFYALYHATVLAWVR